MSPLSRLMAHSAKLAHSDTFFTGTLGSRIVVAGACVPLELLVSLHNAIKLPWQAAQMAIKLPATALNVFVRSKSLDEFEKTLAGPIQIIETALKVVAYAIGTVFSLTLGFISPKANFRVHIALGLVIDQQAETDKERVEAEREKKREEYEKAIEAHIRTIVEAIKLKNAEKERELVNAALPQPIVEPTPIEPVTAPIESIPTAKEAPVVAVEEPSESPQHLPETVESQAA